MQQQSELKEALKTLEDYIMFLTKSAGLDAAYGQGLWNGIVTSDGLLKELSYYHDYGDFLCEYKINGYTITDIIVWQVDHFKLYMDRHNEMNRYKSEKLLLSAFEIMIEMEKNPDSIIKKLETESGQDVANNSLDL